MKRIVLLATAALLATACTASTGDESSGAQLYQTSCAGCHGADLSGGSALTQGPDIGPGSNTDLALSDEQIAGVIEAGPGSMPSFGRALSDEQIAKVVAYIRSVNERG
jgi:mono/diheme cytochrome c family protein